MMKKPWLAFLLQLSLVTLAMIGILLGVVYSTAWSFPSYTIAIFVVLFIVTFFGFLLQFKVMVNYPDYSLHVILGSLILRLIIFVVLNFVIIYTDRPNALPNIILFFSIYLIFTTVEMITLFKKVNQAKTLA